MILREKKDSELILDLHVLRAREKDTVAEILQYLLEVERRSLHLEKGFSSMHDFCERSLGYSKDEAHIRVQAMRLLKALPQVEEKIRGGTLCLSSAAKIQVAFRKENQRRKSLQMPSLKVQEKELVLESLDQKSTRDCARALAEIFPETNLIPEKTRPLDANRTLIQFVADKHLLKKLEELKKHLAHKNYEGRWDLLFDELATQALKKFKQPEKPFVAQRGAKRYIPLATRREVFKRAKGQCEYENCKSTHAMQIDHIKPYALGGPSEIANLRLLCASHNQFLAQRLFKSKISVGNLNSGEGELMRL